MPSPRFWQWPNLIALDAVVVALIWQLTFEQAMGGHIIHSEQLVLGLSVWLTYMADRLFDARHSVANQPISDRHQFARDHSKSIWMIWWLLLGVNCLIAIRFLSLESLKNGFVLLFACLMYTALNQRFSKYFFPKELCVALIFSGGVIVFFEPPYPWEETVAFALLCLCNCIAISLKERTTDAAMGLHSLSSIKPSVVLPLCFGPTLLAIYLIEPTLGTPIFISLSGLAILQVFNKRLGDECFRVAIDAALLLGPIVSLTLRL